MRSAGLKDAVFLIIVTIERKCSDDDGGGEDEMMHRRMAMSRRMVVAMMILLVMVVKRLGFRVRVRKIPRSYVAEDNGVPLSDEGRLRRGAWPLTKISHQLRPHQHATLALLFWYEF